MSKTHTSLFLVFMMLLVCRGETATAADPLSSWNAGRAKQSVLDFVEAVTDEGSAGYVPAADRIAVFDNDGCLWPENPLPFQVSFAVDEIRRMAPQHPEWQDDATLSAVLKGDVVALHADLKTSLVKILSTTHAGMTTDEFAARVKAWSESAKHPRFDRHYVELAYQPMLEVLEYLRANGFRTYIVSGGGVDFMRVWAEQTYGIPPEQVIGSIGDVHFELRETGPVLVKDAGLTFNDDKAGKPVAIHRQIGRRPIACFGNSDGDWQMLQWTTIGRTPSFGLIVHHTDAEREYAYDAHPKSSGKLVEALKEAPTRGWTVVDMRQDWNRVFAPVNQ